MAKDEGVAARHSSATAEHYTPPSIVEAARAVLGAIDLDPASCAAANLRVRAALWHGISSDGLKSPWSGRVFLNPPGGRGEGNVSNQKLWWQRLAQAWQCGDVTAAIFVCFSVELLQTTQVHPVGPLPLDFPICYPSRRVAYYREDGTVGGSPPHSSAIVYLPEAADPLAEGRFGAHFASIGKVVCPLSCAVRP